MMTLPVTPPVLQSPPEEYDREYMKHMISQLEIYIKRLNAAGKIQATTINLSQLPTSSVGLKTGDLWNDSGTVKIV
jgi:hypothetical protein